MCMIFSFKAVTGDRRTADLLPSGCFPVCFDCFSSILCSQPGQPSLSHWDLHLDLFIPSDRCLGTRCSAINVELPTSWNTSSISLLETPESASSASLAGTGGESSRPGCCGSHVSSCTSTDVLNFLVSVSSDKLKLGSTDWGLPVEWPESKSWAVESKHIHHYSFTTSERSLFVYVFL